MRGKTLDVARLSRLVYQIKRGALLGPRGDFVRQLGLQRMSGLHVLAYLIVDHVDQPLGNRHRQGAAEALCIACSTILLID
jgi:hypothetical protein